MDVLTRLAWSPAWVVEPADDDTALVLSAGADRRVAVDGLDPCDRATVHRWAGGGTVTDDGSGRAVGRLLDRLVELGAVVPEAAPGPPEVVAGDARVATALRGLVSGVGVGGHNGPVVAVRTGSGWPAVPAGRLHLGVDLSMHHTIVLGSLVVPGVSACLACLDARSAHRWAAPTVPPAPAVQRHLAVVACLLDVQLALVAAGTSPLVNATIAWDLETGVSGRQSLYRLVGCPGCAAVFDGAPPPPPPDPDPDSDSDSDSDDSGRVALPWDGEP